MDLDSIKYADLRSLAKELGLKANGKADKLLKTIKHHYEQENKLKAVQGKGNVNVQEEDKAHRSEDSVQDGEDAVCKEEASDFNVFVNTRRGRGNASKRRLADPASDCDAKGDGKVDAQSTPCSAQGKKKRKLSSDKDSGKTASESHQSGSDQQLSDSKDEAPACHETSQEKGKYPKVVKGGRIPRYQGLQQKSKTVTPNFKKIHEARFNKMESIDTYVQRKTKKMEVYKNSVNDLKEPSDKQKPEGKAGPKVNPTRASMFSPASVKKRAAEEKDRQAFQNKTAGKEDVSFRPSVLFTRRINVRFSEATCDNEFKGSLLKTPARMSLSVTSTPPKQTTEVGKRNSLRTSTFSAQKTPGPFVFTGNTSTPGTQKKTTFDLKASLSRPLTYKPHKGKLKPFGDVKENASANKSLVSNPHQEIYKQHKVQSREDRRMKQMDNRKQKKESILGARRGLVMN
ncbi:nucleolar and spindle-associated protein 1 [Kryptolebias marmoratus]|uniref:Nucleolar and spindle associated protein 1 n=1 Tax=Kryptolebias marmoratus TaxID=37003 RepID=A0A3Q3AVZ8_KRYMA|nr:nucleolar and spindle-associated protein 1 [Kryptolebias marmoratus]